MIVSSDQKDKAVLFGGRWYSPSLSGPVAAYWNGYPTYSDHDISARRISNHLRGGY